MAGMETTPAPRLDELLCFPVYRAARAMVRAYTPLLARFGLTYPQYLVMLVLWEAGEPQAVGAIGERLDLDSATLTPLLKRLEATGQVLRRRDPADERRVLVELTDTGADLRAGIGVVHRQLGACLGITAAEATQLRGLVERLI
jgi:DNA-binding MarR family transcriptional regulator